MKRRGKVGNEREHEPEVIKHAASLASRVMIHACDQGSVTPLRRNDVRRRSSSTPLKVGIQAEPLDSRQGAMHEDCPRVVMHMHESTSTLINSHACMHACTHAARTQKPHQQPSHGRMSQAIIGTHCLAIARDLVAPRGSDGSGRTHLFVHCVTSQRCHSDV
jgi:hypothetical protein